MSLESQIKVGIIGATGFAGAELVALLDTHPHFKVTCLGSSSAAGERLSFFYPQIAGRSYDFVMDDIDTVFAADIDLLFLAVPHTQAFNLAYQALEAGIKVVDLSADYRLSDSQLYETHYQTKHPHPELIKQAVYGIPELYHNQISRTNLVANPGCYPTASIFALAPVLSSHLSGILKNPIIIDAKSGVSGAGRAANATTHFCNIAENFYAYKPFSHQHQPEIEQAYRQMSGNKAEVLFVPHLLPIKRGLLASVYASFEGTGLTIDEIYQTYAKFYQNEPFVDLLGLGEFPNIKEVVGTNRALVGIAFDEDRQVLTASCAIDNLGKGAASQAVQNANIMFGLDEEIGLHNYKVVV